MTAPDALLALAERLRFHAATWLALHPNFPAVAADMNAAADALLGADTDRMIAQAEADQLRAALAAEPEATWPLNAAAEPDREPFDGTPEDFGHEDCEVCNAARALRAPVEREATDEEVARELVGIWEDTAGIEPRTRPLVQELDRALVWVRAVRAATVRAQEGR